MTTTTPPQPEEPDRPSEEETEGEAGSGQRRWRFPTAFTVLAIVLLLVWVASFIIPSGSYEFDKAGAPVPGSYTELPDCTGERGEGPCADKAVPEQLKQLWISVPNGLYGIENARGTSEKAIVPSQSSRTMRARAAAMMAS